MRQDKETTAPLDLLDSAAAEKLKNLRDLNGLTDEDINNIALILAGKNAESRVMLYGHQKNHHDIIDRLKELELKVRREHINLQQYNKEHETNLKTVLIISKR